MRRPSSRSTPVHLMLDLLLMKIFLYALSIRANL